MGSYFLFFVADAAGDFGSKIVTWLLTTSLEFEKLEVAKLEVAKQAAEAVPEKGLWAISCWYCYDTLRKVYCVKDVRGAILSVHTVL